MKFSENPIAEIIAIGDELTSGQRLDTNSQWLSQQISDLGIRTGFHTTVSDDLQHQSKAIEIACRRAQLVVMTGGLGPTDDDLTREAIASAAGVELVSDPQALEHIESIFRKNSRVMSPANQRQALYPQGGRTLHNEEGTAPGVMFCFNNEKSALLFALPGVPYEMKKMYTDEVQPEIEASIPGDLIIRHHVIRCFGIGESSAEAKMPGLISRDRSPRVGITASFATISFRIIAMANSEQECENQIRETETYIRETLGSVVFGEGEDRIETVTASLLKQAGYSVAMADFQFGGAAASLLRSASLPPEDPMVASSVAVDRLTTEQWIQQVGGSGNSDCVLTNAADLIRTRENCDIGIAIGRLQSEDPQQRRGKFEVVIQMPDGETESETFDFAGHSGMREIRSAKQVVDFLRRSILKRAPTP